MLYKCFTYNNQILCLLLIKILAFYISTKIRIYIINLEYLFIIEVSIISIKCWFVADYWAHQINLGGI